VVSYKVQVPEAQSLAGDKTINESWLVDVDKLEASKADVATGGHAKSKSDIGAGSHHFLLNNERARLPPT
jgi:hypothetical protein